jgi:hypothetical protein
MRLPLLLISAGLLAGCASQQPQTMSKGNQDLSSASAALVFDPPIAMNTPPVDLSRETHGEAAYAGFEDTTTTQFYIRTDDRETTDFSNRFEREGFSEKVGSTRR